MREWPGVCEDVTTGGGIASVGVVVRLERSGVVASMLVRLVLPLPMGPPLVVLVVQLMLLKLPRVLLLGLVPDAAVAVAA